MKPLPIALAVMLLAPVAGADEKITYVASDWSEVLNISISCTKDVPCSCFKDCICYMEDGIKNIRECTIDQPAGRVITDIVKLNDGSIGTCYREEEPKDQPAESLPCCDVPKEIDNLDIRNCKICNQPAEEATPDENTRFIATKGNTVWEVDKDGKFIKELFSSSDSEIWREKCDGYLNMGEEECLPTSSPEKRKKCEDIYKLATAYCTRYNSELLKEIEDKIK